MIISIGTEKAFYEIQHHFIIKTYLYRSIASQHNKIHI